MQSIESDPNPFPKIDLFPKVTKIARAIGGLFCMHQLASHGDHDFNHGAAPALDRALYDNGQLLLWNENDILEQ